MHINVLFTASGASLVKQVSHVLNGGSATGSVPRGEYPRVALSKKSLEKFSVAARNGDLTKPVEKRMIFNIVTYLQRL
jgi:hypothetical protein